MMLLLSYCFGYYRDMQDNKSKCYITSENYDKSQYLLVKFQKENFNGYNLFKLYFYLVKVK